ncbi:hypothetical protein [Alkalicoccus luteus]|uniref:Uncharacterized protein n=1 Tax=Alkalicoccus luteus TaxID=1237094 RepID=A0A969TUR5_9BACI|nr:hypothetical protein [Alkalicoccus luteus]NJP37615.1 hypothetical protein [Alkalicoccus luteus]
MNYRAKFAEGLGLAADYFIIRLLFVIPMLASLSLTAEILSVSLLLLLVYGILPAAGVQSLGQLLTKVRLSGPFRSFLLRGFVAACLWIPARLLAELMMVMDSRITESIYLVYIIVIMVYLLRSYLSLKPSLLSWSLLVKR